MKIESDDPKWILRYFDSVRDCVEYADRDIVGYGASRTEGTGLAGVPFPEAVELAKYGWSDIRPGVDAVLEPVREKLMETLDYSQEPALDMVGFEPNIDLYLSGELECMHEWMPRELPAKGKVFNLVINGSYTCAVSKDTILAKGAAVTALVEAFQMLGFDMNIFVEAGCKPGYGTKYSNWTSLVRIHRAGDNLDINNVMFPLGNPAWFRRIIFGVMEQENVSVRKQFGFGMTEDDYSHGNYGYPASLKCDAMVEASFVMSIQDTAGRDVADPVGWILDQLEAQGVWNNG